MEYMKVYLVDEGILLTKENKEFDAYAIVYDKKYGYYDTAQYYVKNKTDAIKCAKAYVEENGENTYAIVSNTGVRSDFDFENGYVEGETYFAENVIYSVAKINGEIVENFMSK